MGWLSEKKKKYLDKNNPFVGNPILNPIGALTGNEVGTAQWNPLAWGTGGLLDLFGGGSSPSTIGGLDSAAYKRRTGAIKDTLLKYGETEVDRESQAEIGKYLSKYNVGAAEKVLKGAREQVLPKYKMRMGVQKRFDFLVDMPGSKQTRDTGVSMLMSNSAPGGTGRGG